MLNPFINATNKVFVVLGVILLIHGTAGFTLFIFEESMQTMMFASFAFKESKDCHGMFIHKERMSSVHRMSEKWINTVGLLAIVMFPAYRTYLLSDESYIDSVESWYKENC